MHVALLRRRSVHVLVRMLCRVRIWYRMAYWDIFDLRHVLHRGHVFDLMLWRTLRMRRALRLWNAMLHMYILRLLEKNECHTVSI